MAGDKQWYLCARQPVEGTQNMLCEQYCGGVKLFEQFNFHQCVTNEQYWEGEAQAVEQLLLKTLEIGAILHRFCVFSQNLRLAPSALARRPLTNLGAKRGKKWPLCVHGFRSPSNFGGICGSSIRCAPMGEVGMAHLCFTHLYFTIPVLF